MPLLHASPRPSTSAFSDTTTGEVRVPIDLYSLDQPQGPVDLVLSAREAEELHGQLSMLLRQSARAV
jgi:hypothetical protein